jgi:hypothetical protein
VTLDARYIDTISGGALIVWSRLVPVFVAFVFDERHVLHTSATTRHACTSPRHATSASRYVNYRPVELPFTPRGTCCEVAEVDSDAEETLWAEEERRVC